MRDYVSRANLAGRKDRFDRVSYGADTQRTGMFLGRFCLIVLQNFSCFFGNGRKAAFPIQGGQFIEFHTDQNLGIIKSIVMQYIQLILRILVVVSLVVAIPVANQWLSKFNKIIAIQYRITTK